MGPMPAALARDGWHAGNVALRQALTRDIVREAPPRAGDRRHEIGKIAVGAPMRRRDGANVKMCIFGPIKGP